MSTTPSHRRKAGREAARDGMPRAAPERYFSADYIADWLEGYDREMEVLEIRYQQEQQEANEAARFLNFEVAPIAEALGVPAEALADLVDLIVKRVKETS